MFMMALLSSVLDVSRTFILLFTPQKLLSGSSRAADHTCCCRALHGLLITLAVGGFRRTPHKLLSDSSRVADDTCCWWFTGC
jgi:hypothetical protein